MIFCITRKLDPHFNISIFAKDLLLSLFYFQKRMVISKDSKMQEGAMFSLCHSHVFHIFQEIFFVPYEKNVLNFKFFSWGDKNRFLGKMKKERQGKTGTLQVFWILCPFNVILFQFSSKIIYWSFHVHYCTYRKIIKNYTNISKHWNTDKSLLKPRTHPKCTKTEIELFLNVTILHNEHSLF